MLANKQEPGMQGQFGAQLEWLALNEVYVGEKVFILLILKIIIIWYSIGTSLSLRSVLWGEKVRERGRGRRIGRGGD